MALEIKQALEESDKGSYYNQEGFFADFDDNAESCETDSSSDSLSKSVSYLKLNSSTAESREESDTSEDSESDQEINIELNTERQSENESDSSVDEQEEPTVHSRLIIHLETLQESVQKAAICKQCADGTLQLEHLSDRRGLCSRLQWICSNCSCATEFYSDANTGFGSGHSRDVNRLSVLAMRTIGKSRNALLKLCSIMDLPAPVNYKPFGNHTEVLKDAAKNACEDKMSEAAEELKKVKRDSPEWDGEGSCKCAVSVDGSWAHVGYSSRYGFVSTISIDTGKVLDYVTLSNECKGCKKWEREGKTNTREFLSWFVEHDKVCTLNHEGSAKTMEAQGAVILFRRSEELHGLEYTTCVGDGDSSANSSVVDSHPYGPNIIIQKEGRMGKHLKRVVEQYKGMYAISIIKKIRKNDNKL